MSDTTHVTPDLEAMGHHESKAKDGSGGACIWPHGNCYVRREGFSCSYRWQAHLHAEDTAALYERYESATSRASIPTSQNPKTLYPAYYIARLLPPRAGDWDVHGPKLEPGILREGSTTEVRVAPGLNFHNSTFPYWNNAHHIIPKGTLKHTIKKSCESRPGMEEFVKHGLLKAKYSVHARVNMMLMPMDQEVAAIIKIPRHLQLHLDDGPRSNPRNHQFYNAMVAERLADIVADFMRAFDQAVDEAAKTGHPFMEWKLSKKKLERLSRDLFREIVKHGGTKDGTNGVSLDAMATPPGFK